MAANEGVTIGVLAERIKAVQEDVAELRQIRKDDHHRLRSVEAAVSQMIDAQKAARESESRQYRKMAASIQMGALSMSVAMVILSIVTFVVHYH